MAQQMQEPSPGLEVGASTPAGRRAGGQAGGAVCRSRLSPSLSLPPISSLQAVPDPVPSPGQIPGAHSIRCPARWGRGPLPGTLALTLVIGTLAPVDGPSLLC